MGYQNDLLVGFAQLLADATVGTWSTSAAYSAGDKGITLQVLPTSPDDVIALSTYPVTDDPTLSDSVTGLQVMTRQTGADPRPTNDLADSVFDQLQGLAGVDLSTGLHVVFCEHRSGSLLGQDDNKRWSRSDNYYVTTHRPSPNRQ